MEVAPLKFSLHPSACKATVFIHGGKFSLHYACKPAPQLFPANPLIQVSMSWETAFVHIKTAMVSSVNQANRIIDI